MYLARLSTSRAAAFLFSYSFFRNHKFESLYIHKKRQSHFKNTRIVEITWNLFHKLSKIFHIYSLINFRSVPYLRELWAELLALHSFFHFWNFSKSLIFSWNLLGWLRRGKCESDSLPQPITAFSDTFLMTHVMTHICPAAICTNL